MNTRVPTPRQATMLRSYSRGILPAAGKGVAPLIRWGWLETLDGTPPIQGDNGRYPPLRVSATGWAAIGLAVDAGRLSAYTFADTDRTRS